MDLVEGRTIMMIEAPLTVNIVVMMHRDTSLIVDMTLIAVGRFQKRSGVPITVSTIGVIEACHHPLMASTGPISMVTTSLLPPRLGLLPQ